MSWKPFIDRGDDDRGLVSDGELVVSGSDGSVAFEAVDAAFHRVALLVDVLVKRGRSSTTPASVLAVADLVGLLRDRASDATPAQVGPVGAGTVGLVAQYPVRARPPPSPTGTGHTDPFQHGLELRRVTPLPGRDHQRQWLLALLCGQMQLRGQPTPRPTDPVIIRLDVDPTRRFTLVSPFLRAPAACWCARATVESTLTSQVINPSASAWACNRVRIRFQVPSRCQRRNNPYTVCHGPYRSGRSRHCTPVRTRNRIPLISCRFGCLGGRPDFFPLGNNGSSFAHCSFVRSPRPTRRSSQTEINF